MVWTWFLTHGRVCAWHAVEMHPNWATSLWTWPLKNFALPTDGSAPQATLIPPWTSHHDCHTEGGRSCCGREHDVQVCRVMQKSEVSHRQRRTPDHSSTSSSVNVSPEFVIMWCKTCHVDETVPEESGFPVLERQLPDTGPGTAKYDGYGAVMSRFPKVNSAGLFMCN